MKDNATETLEVKVLNSLQKEEAISFENLAKELEMTNVNEMAELQTLLIKLQQDYKVSTTKKGKYLLFNDPNIMIGTLDVKRRDDDGSLYGFVMVEGMDKDILVNDIDGALDGEKVAVKLTKGRRNDDRKRGEILKVIEKKPLENLVGEVVFDEQGKMHVILDDKRIGITLNIENNPLNAVSGHKVVAKVYRDGSKKERFGEYNGEILKVIGHKNEPGVDILSIAYEHGASVEWPEEVMNQLKNIPNEVTEKDLVGRRDLREEMIFTIDGDDTKDIDDAVSVKKLDNGNYLVGVHIANVSYYVTKGSPLDKEAYKRGTSIYMIDTVIPMLPPQLSNGICSLNPNVDRLAMSVEMEIDKDGNVINHDFFTSVIRSRKQMTYNNVNSILEEDTIPEGYEEFADTIKMLNEVALIIRKNKVDRGMLEFASHEIKFKFDENHVPNEIVKREQRSGEKLIEDLMVVANETIATMMESVGFPSIYRIHETPDAEKVQELVMIADALGIVIPNKNKKFELFPKAFQELINYIKTDEKVYKLLAELSVRTQKKAIYSMDNIGHFGLASKCYTHFTSPIRRYPDQELHRLLEIAFVIKDFSTKTISKLEDGLPVTCEYASIREREAEKCERDADDMKMAEMMSNHIGEGYSGIVTGLTNDALFIELSNNAEGRMHISELKDDTYSYDETLYRFAGKNSGKVYTFGTSVDVVVKNAVKDTRRIDLIPATALAKENDETDLSASKVLTKEMK